MSDIEEAFRDMVASQSAVSAIIGVGLEARIYPGKLPQNPTLPAMTYQLISGPRDYNQQGADGVVRFRFQLDMYGRTYGEVVTLKRVTLAAISGLHNQSFGSPPTVIQGCFVANEGDQYDSALDQVGPTPEFRKVVDFFVTAPAN